MSTTFEPKELRPVILSLEWPGMLTKLLEGADNWYLAEARKIAEETGETLKDLDVYHDTYVAMMRSRRLRLRITGPNASVTTLGKANKKKIKVETYPALSREGYTVAAVQNIAVDEHCPVWECLLWRRSRGELRKVPKYAYHVGCPDFRKTPTLWEIEEDSRTLADAALARDPWCDDLKEALVHLTSLSMPYKMRFDASCGIITQRDPEIIREMDLRLIANTTLNEKNSLCHNIDDEDNIIGLVW